LTKLRNQAVKVQETLTDLNSGQDFILNAGTTLNLILAARDVATNRITPGTFILI
jgi:ABC-type transport system involved in Fe-S cluster assembly fused permease/ATPase subunit